MGKKQFLVADDDPDVLQVVKAILEHEGFQVRTARDGEQAYKLLRKRSFDAVILDMNMPKARGDKVLQLIRRSSKLKDIPVMLITGDVREAQRIQENGIAKLASSYLIKPFSTRDLIKCVRALVASEKVEQPEQKPSGQSRPSRI